MKDDYSTAENKSRQGLCTFCDVAAGCALIEPAGMPVLECEEFRVVRPQGRVAQEKDALDAKSAEATRSERRDDTDWREKGLCGNCAIYDTCPFSQAEGGIWHCEEYR